MKIAYLVAVHKNAAQVGRLLRRLASDESKFLIHVDRRAGRAFEAAVRREAESVSAEFVRRHRCFWGGFGLVRAALSGIEHLVAEGIPFDYVVLLSGQDYPLRSAAAIESFFREADGRSYIHNERLPTSFWDGGGFSRVEQWHLVSYRALHLRVPWQRTVPAGLAPYGGEAWWSMSRPVAEHVVQFVAANPAVVRFFEHALIADELFFQTIVMNSPFADTVVNDHRRYIDWSADPGPAVLGMSDLSALRHSDKLFARKFDEHVDSQVLDALDEWIDAPR
jgi:hypothetical protein